MQGFDENEYGAPDSPEETPAAAPKQGPSTAAGDVVSLLTDNEPLEPVDEGYLTDVDRRLEVAQYYRELLRAPLFGETTPSAAIVEREVRLFVRDRLELLLSIKAGAPAPTTSPFTDDELAVLRVLIKQVMMRPGAFSDKPATPTVHQAQAPTVNKAALPSKPTPLITSSFEKLVFKTGTPPTGALITSTPPPKRAPKPQDKRPAKKAVPAIPAVSVKKTVVANDGESHEIEVQRIQRPAGAVPFPANIELATAAAAASGAQAGARILNSIISSVK